MRLASLVLLGVVACNTPVRPDGGRGTAATEEAPPTRPSATERGGDSRGLAPTPKGTLGPSGTILLASGASLTPPAGAKAFDVPAALPSEVRSAHVFELVGGARLMVNELTHEGQTCEAALEKEWAKMQAARGDTDPERLKYRQMKSVDRLDVDGRRAIYGASSHGTGEPGQLAALATLLFCAGEDQVVAMLAAKQAEVPTDAKDVLLGLVKSYRASK